MDDKTFIASYVAGEAERINQRLKKMVQSDTQPTDAERDEVIKDIETTLARLQSALAQISMEDLEEEKEYDKIPQ